jgi:hypothetical protein
MCNPSVAPDPKPAKLLRAELAQARDDGLPFDEAWDYALKMAKGDKWWTAAFEWSRDEWRACYERRPQTPRGNTLEQLALPSVGTGYSAGPDDLTAA